MGIFESFKNALGGRRDIDVEEFMNAAEAEELDALHQKADFYVKPIALQGDGDIAVVKHELEQKNIILLNISPIIKNQNLLKSSIASLKGYVDGINGDMARIDENKILLTPTNVKIVKKRVKR